MAAIAFILSSVVVIVEEPYTGCAIIGWGGDNMVVERKRHPGPCWFTIGLHTFIGAALSVLLLLATQQRRTT